MSIFSIFLILSSVQNAWTGFYLSFAPNIWPPNLNCTTKGVFGLYKLWPNGTSFSTQGVYPQDSQCLAVGGVCTDQLGCDGAGGILSPNNVKCPSSPKAIRCCLSSTISKFIQDKECTSLGGVCTDRPGCSAIWRLLNPTNAECPSSPNYIRCCLSASIPVYPQDPMCTAQGGFCTDQLSCHAVGRQLSPTNYECRSTPDIVRCCRSIPDYHQDPQCTKEGGICTDTPHCTAMGGRTSTANAKCSSTPANAVCCVTSPVTAVFQDPQCMALNGFCTSLETCVAAGGQFLPTNNECPSTSMVIRCCLTQSSATSSQKPGISKVGNPWIW